MKTYIKEHLRDALYICVVYVFSLVTASLIMGCHSRLHTSRHYNASGELIHKDRTRSYSLFGKSEAAKLQGEYDYSSVVDGKTNLTHTVRFGVDAEKKGVDAEGLKAGGGAVGEVIGTAGEKILKP